MSFQQKSSTDTRTFRFPRPPMYTGPRRKELTRSFDPRYSCKHNWVDSAMDSSGLKQYCPKCKAKCVRESTGLIIEFEADVKIEEEFTARA